MITDEIGDKHEERNKGKSRDGKLTLLKEIVFSLTAIQEEEKSTNKNGRDRCLWRENCLGTKDWNDGIVLIFK